MLILLGFLVVLCAIVGGFWMHGGNPLVLLQVSELVIIGGAALGTLLVTMDRAEAKLLLVQVRGLVSGAGRYDRETFHETLLLLHQLFARSNTDMRRVEADIERPARSPLFRRHPRVLAHPEIVEVITDTYKVLLTGTVQDHHLSELLDHDLRRRRKDALAPARRIETLSDALPGFGIVAAVLGVIVTMGYIGGAPEVIGHRIAGAMVGTFLGVLLAYGVTGPLAGALRSQVEARHALYECIRNALLSHARGDVPSLSVEFGRRMIPEEMRPAFNDAEAMMRASRRRTAAGEPSPEKEPVA
jgi:chemotaxis protein MotA